jgi:hypothetical protein
LRDFYIVGLMPHYSCGSNRPVGVTLHMFRNYIFSCIVKYSP